MEVKEFINESKEAARDIYIAGKEDSSKENFYKLLELDKTGEWIFQAGRDWWEFDFKRALDRLIEIDKTGTFIINAGERWPKFDYKKALDALIKVNKNGFYIYFAGNNWKEFDYVKGLKALEGTKYHDKAINEWWRKSPEIAKIKNKLEMDKAEQFPQKKFKLKEFINEDKETAENIFFEGKKDPNKEDFDKLLGVDKTGNWIYYAGHYWKNFDFKRGLDKLLEVDKTGDWIFWAGKKWEEFDYKKGLDGLIKLNKDLYLGDIIYDAGRDWKEFDYEKAIKALEGTKHYVRAINEWWKKSPEIAKLKNEKVKKEATQIPQKKFKLKEFVEIDKKS